MAKITVSLDVGGTEIKAAAVENGTLLTEIMPFPYTADGDHAFSRTVGRIRKRDTR